MRPATDGSIGYHLGLSKPTVVGIKHRKVVERDTKIAAVWPVKPFIDCDRAVDHAAKSVEAQEYLNRVDVSRLAKNTLAAASRGPPADWRKDVWR
jgi:hypothetical protein